MFLLDTDTVIYMRKRRSYEKLEKSPAATRGCRPWTPQRVKD
jgi:hypothetical protein